LQGTFEPGNIGVSFLGMFLTNATVDPLPPEIETTAFEFAPHQRNNLRLTKCKLYPYRFKGRSIFPGHLDDSVNVFLLHPVKVVFGQQY
jgi:hypothetical protein